MAIVAGTTMAGKLIYFLCQYNITNYRRLIHLYTESNAKLQVKYGDNYHRILIFITYFPLIKK
jgi:hypothetical protein